jgi:hypothetical protein
MQKREPVRLDYEYERNGTANVFMMFAPLEGWRHVKVTQRRTAVDYASVLKDLSDVHFPGAKTIVLVQDNLNTHTPASLYEAFPAPEARRLVERFEWHYTENTAAGLTWPSRNSGSWPRNASTAASRTEKHSLRKSLLGRASATAITPKPIGTSQLQMPGSNSSASILHFE